jgi:signal transduction histidine kinase
MEINVCQLAEGNWQSIHTLAYYSHLIPVAISIILMIFTLIKSNYSLLSRVFSWFVVGFCLWLIGDVIIWTNNDYHLITALWAPLDYINVLFYLWATYFFVVLISERDITNTHKVIILLLALPAWWITATGHSITGFNQSVCEAENSSLLTNYKLIIEFISIGFIAIYGLHRAITDKVKRKQIALVGLALVLFLTVFASTEYISSVTGIYEMNLYSLLVLPLFLAMIIFSITNLRVFALKTFGTQLSIYVLLIMIASQFFFIKDVTNRWLTGITLVLSAFIGTVLARNIRREETLTEQLQLSNEGQENLIHIMNHQVKGYLAKGRNIFSELMTEPEYKLASEAKPLVDEGMKSLTEGVDFVQQILRGSSAESGKLIYTMKPVDMKSVVNTAVQEMMDLAKSKNLTLSFEPEDGDFNLVGDEIQLREAVKNLVSNSLNYTVEGSVITSLKKKGTMALISVKDTGIGICREDMPRLFVKGGRGKDSLKYNVNSTGYGLAFTKAVIEAHKGRIWVDSAGTGKGSIFYVELPLS